jgi:hypothetical protein
MQKWRDKMPSPSLELQNPEAYATMVRDVLEDAVTRFVALAAAGALGQVEFAGLEIYAFRQTWPDASCGFGGIAAQALTDAQTVVVSWTDGDVAAVYMRGQFAYLVNTPSQVFWDALAEHDLPGAAAPHEHLSR